MPRLGFPGLLLVLLGLSACSDPERVAEALSQPAPPPPPELPPTPVPSPQKPWHFANNPEVGGYIWAQRGDTLYDIARKFRLTPRELAEANEIAPPYELKHGQKLRIPPQRLHLVAAGDTVYGLSQRYHLGMAELTKRNGIEPPYEIVVGQRLYLPAEKPAPAGPAPFAPALAASPGSQVPSATQQAAVPMPPEEPAPLRPTPSAAVPMPPPLADGQFAWPVRGRVVSYFGPQADGRHNDGINIVVAAGAPVEAAENGVVAYAGNELRGFGNMVLIKHAEGWVTAYAHNRELLVAKGDEVARGQVIARAGASGSVSEPQVHFEVRKGTRALDPLTMLGPQSATN
ncbi:MAG: M23 family metallopeptidase [Tistlia sp.]|uniref:peptidoglycan DD-metalloendopeptidase family protein n=1 Tax=Tistlia sp. TaxID=3057121 RepID=UPI0034A369B6